MTVVIQDVKITVTGRNKKPARLLTSEIRDPLFQKANVITTNGMHAVWEQEA